MFNLPVDNYRHVHADRIERYLGADKVAHISNAMRGFYWPVAVHGVAGKVWAMPGGDFCGEIRGGEEVAAVERAMDTVKRIERARFARRAMSRKQLGAFANLSAIITAATSGKKQDIIFQKTGVAANAIGNSNELWTRAGQPAAGVTAGAAPGGTVYTASNTGALGFKNIATANGAHFTTGAVTASVAGNSLLLYDRLFAVAKTMNSTTTEAVTGVPTRYQNQTTGAEDYIGGNFCFPANTTTALAATAHNWTVCQYTNQGGTAAQSFTSVAGVSSCVIGGVDLAVGNWFLPLGSGDVGVKALTQMQCSAAVATGAIHFVIGHPIAILPCPVANMMCIVDGINTAFNLTRVYDNACLTFLELTKPSTTATNYSGVITTVNE